MNKHYEELKNENGYAEAIANAREIARNGSKKDKEEFVDWAHRMLAYAKEQLAVVGGIENAKGLWAVEDQYEAYLEELKKNV